jgi:Amidase
MSDRERAVPAAALRARLAAAGLEVPEDAAAGLERDFALHLERLAELEAAADLGPADPPLTGPVAPPPGLGRVAPPSAVPEAGAPPAGSVGEPGGLVQAARLVREGLANSAELVERALERVAALDGRVGAFVTVLAGEARAEAAARDAQRRRGEALGPLHGVPLAVKDLVDVAGAVTGAGSPKLAGNWAARDAEGCCCVASSRARSNGDLALDQIATASSSNAIASRWFAGASTASS